MSAADVSEVDENESAADEVTQAVASAVVSERLIYH